jgi:hypothetical protein
MRKASLLSAFITELLLLTGCPPGGPAGPISPAPFESRRAALEHVNDNLAQLRQPLVCRALVSFTFRDQAGKQHAFNLHEARLTFQTPQDLLFDVRSLAGTVAQFGSNAQRYWLWLDVPDLEKLWWGDWGQISAATERRLPIPPNELLDALLLRPLPESLEGGQLPIAARDDVYRLLFVRLGAGGQPVGYREVLFAPSPPYMPTDILDRTPDGQLVMHAELRDYRRVDEEGPLTPRRYIVQWPARAELRLDITSASMRDELPEGVFEFPVGWQGEVEAIDAPVPVRVPRAQPPPTANPGVNQP